MRQKYSSVTPRTIWKLIVGNPLKARWELGKATPINIFHKSNPCGVISWDAYLSILHHIQHCFNSSDALAYFLCYRDLLRKIIKKKEKSYDLSYLFIYLFVVHSKIVVSDKEKRLLSNHLSSIFFCVILHNIVRPVYQWQTILLLKQICIFCTEIMSSNNIWI